jgi:hypothetical protein
MGRVALRRRWRKGGSKEDERRNDPPEGGQRKEQEGVLAYSARTTNQKQRKDRECDGTLMEMR